MREFRKKTVAAAVALSMIATPAVSVADDGGDAAARPPCSDAQKKANDAAQAAFQKYVDVFETPAESKAMNNSCLHSLMSTNLGFDPLGMLGNVIGGIMNSLYKMACGAINSVVDGINSTLRSTLKFDSLKVPMPDGSTYNANAFKTTSAPASQSGSLVNLNTPGIAPSGSSTGGGTPSGQTGNGIVGSLTGLFK